MKRAIFMHLRPQRRARGYTVVELMMALVIFAIGVTGVVAMQKVTSNANGHAKNLAIATHIAQSWQERLAVDATQWGQNGTAVITNTTWVNGVNSSEEWVLPAQNTTLDFGPGFDALGSFVDITTTAGAARAVFCTHLRLTHLLTTEGSRLVRSEVRVFWPKPGRTFDSGNAYCASGASVTDIGAATNDFHFVYKTTAIRQTPGFGGGT